MRSSLRCVVLAAVLVVATLGSSFAAGGPRVHRAQASAPRIRVGYFPNITHAQAVLGFGTGAFARALPGVQGEVFNAGPDEMNALFAGAIDIGYIGAGPAIKGYVASHGGLYIVAGAATGGSLLVARAGTGIKSPKDLAGKRVAIPQLGNTQDILLRALLARAHLAPTERGGTVRLLAVQNPDTLALFERGDLDAALVPEPWGSRLVQTTGARIVLDWRQIDGGTTPVTVVIVAAPFLKAHPDLVVRFLRVHVQLTRQVQGTHLGQSKGGVAAALNAQIKALTGKALSAGVLASALARTSFSTTINQRALTRFAGYSIAAGYLKKDAPIAGLVKTWPLAHLNDAAIK
jgi:NitT/TauT family transport system substrate-binding protein